MSRFGEHNYLVVKRSAQAELEAVLGRPLPLAEASRLALALLTEGACVAGLRTRYGLRRTVRARSAVLGLVLDLEVVLGEKDGEPLLAHDGIKRMAYLEHVRLVPDALAPRRAAG